MTAGATLQPLARAVIPGSLMRAAARINILHCITDLHVGGACRLLLGNCAHSDRERFHPAVAYLGTKADMLPRFTVLGLHPSCLGHTGKRYAARTITRLVRKIRRESIHLVHANLLLDKIYAIVAARATGRPVVVTLHTTANPYGPPVAGAARHRWKMRHRLEDFLSRYFVDAFIAVSEPVRQAAIRWRGVSPHKIRVISTGVDPEEYEPSRWDSQALRRHLRKLGATQDSPILLNIGRLCPEKGQTHLVRAMPRILEKYPGAILAIVGEGEERGQLAREIRQANLDEKVALLGLRQDIPELLAGADLVVASSVIEGLGLSVLEAMAARKPLVATRIPAFEAFMRDGENACLAVPADPHDLAAKVNLLLADKALSGRMVRQNLGLVERFHPRSAVRKLEDLYRSLAAERGFAD